MPEHQTGCEVHRSAQYSEVHRSAQYSEIYRSAQDSEAQVFLCSLVILKTVLRFVTLEMLNGLFTIFLHYMTMSPIKLNKRLNKHNKN